MAMTRRDAAMGVAAAACCVGRAGPAIPSNRIGRVRAEDFGAGILRGFNAGDVHHGDAAYFDAVRATGANLVRVAMPFRRCAGCNHYSYRRADNEAMQRILDWAQARNLYVVVLGWFDGVEQPAFWRDAILQDDVVERWRWFATNFGLHPAIAGLDLLNEPNPPRNDGRLAEWHLVWRALALRCVNAIRETGCAAPVVFEPLFGGGPLGVKDLVPLPDRQVVYSVHFYVPLEITHQGVSEPWTQPLSYPSLPSQKLRGDNPALGPGPFNAERLALELAPVREFQLKHGLHMLVGEFSCVRWAPGDSAIGWVSDCLEIFTRYRWSWAYHEFRGWSGWDAELPAIDRNAAIRSADRPMIQLLRRAMSDRRALRR